MKRVKKLLTMVMALAMVFTMSMTAFAQDAATGKGGNGTITVNNASKGVTYTLYKVFDASVGEKGEIVYTKADLAENDYFEKNASGNVVAKDAAYEGAHADNKLSAGAIEWIKANGTEVKSVESDGTALQFTGLEYGYYYITSSLKADGGAITVTSTNPSATVNDKNSETPTWTPNNGDNKGGKSIVLADGKTVDVNDMNIGDTATFQLSINTSNFVDNKPIKEYIIKDTLPEGFTFKKIKSVKVGSTDLTAQFENDSFPLTVKWAEQTADGDFDHSLYDAGAKLVIQYEATLNEKAQIAGNGNVNEAQFGWNYVNNGTGTPGTPENPDGSSDKQTTTTSTYAIALKKVNEKGKALKGAKFSVPFAVTGTAGEYTVTAGTGNTEVECDANGVVVIKGVKAGTYSITETTAPDGYNKLTAPFDVEAVKTGETTTNTTVYLDANGTETTTETNTKVTYTNENLAASVKVVVNKAGSLLPSTGGMGTTIFTVTGAILMLIAAVIFVTRRRMKNVQ